MNASGFVSVARRAGPSIFAGLVLLISLLVFTAAALAVSSILGGCSPEKIYMKADEATYRHVAPIHRKYVLEDETIDEDTKRRRINTLEMWRARLERHHADPEEGAPGPAPIP